MAIEAKICGINDEAALAAALQGGADYVGFVFYPRSPRSLTPGEAAPLSRQAEGKATRVGLLVDAEDDTIAEIMEAADLDLLQLHGAEGPGRVAEIKTRFKTPVMKAVPVAGPEDLRRAEGYLAVADKLLFDAKPPKDMKDALPGGNALSFDWQLLSGRTWALPWMLSGGLDRENLAAAVRTSGARAVDVSSGVEQKPGRKDPEKIKAFLALAKSL